MFEITALDSDRPPLHLYVYTSCERPSIYGQVKNTNNHPPRVKNLLLLSKKFCSAFVHAEAAFWLPVYYHSVFFFFHCANRDPANSEKVPRLCYSLFPVCDIIVYSPKTRWSASLPKAWVAHIPHTRGSTRGAHIYQRMFLVLDAVTSPAVILQDLCAFHCDETLTCAGFRFSVGICNLPT